MLIAHILPCIIELELLTVLSWLLEHASLLVTCWRART